jgi:hypothetical protein
VPRGLQLTAEGHVRVTLRQPWRDGTTDLVIDPMEFLGRLAVLIPRPPINLLLYFGVLGARARGRAEMVGSTRAATGVGDHSPPDAVKPASDERSRRLSEPARAGSSGRP